MSQKRGKAKLKAGEKSSAKQHAMKSMLEHLNRGLLTKDSSGKQSKRKQTKKQTRKWGFVWNYGKDYDI